ncbi:MAG: beta-ketoacyl synthase N-terminal-like domain-containing protein [Syntrophotaleaceae bacterium]
MRASVIGIGWITAAGIGRGRRKDPFAMLPGDLPVFTRKDVFAEAFPRFGRLDGFSRLGLAGIALALDDAGLDQWEQKRNIGVMAGTTYGCLATDIAYFDTVLPEKGAMASPNLFAYTLSNTFLGEAAIRFGLTGSSLVVNDSDHAGFSPLRMALESLAWGESPTMLAGICDLAPMAGMAPTQGPPPGTVFLVLTASRPDSTRVYAEITMDNSGVVSVNGFAVKSWISLVEGCLAGC